MRQCDYRFHAALETRAGETIGDVRLEVDWIPALRWAELEQDIRPDAAKRGPSADRAAHRVIEPLWKEPPYVSGVAVRQGEDDAATVTIPLSYFSNAVTDASAAFVDSGKLADGELFDYRIYALANADNEKAAPPEIDIVAIDEPPRIEPLELAPLVAATGASVEDIAATGPMPVFIPQRVLDESTELAGNVGDIETGGILVGKLCRDPSGTLFSMVTAQIPAEHTAATRESLRFTPESWVSVDAAIRLRNMDEIPLGWWHSHPFFCRQCPPERRTLCPFSRAAFSVADRDVHREVFQKSWSVALLLSFLGDELPSYDVFAWDRGQVQAVPFHTLPDQCSTTEVNK